MAHLIYLICQICQRVRGRVRGHVGGRGSTRPLTTKSCDLSESPRWEAVGVQGGRPISLPRPAVRVQSSGQSHWFHGRSDSLARCAWEADRHLGLPRPHRFCLSQPIRLYWAKQCVWPWNQSDGPEDCTPSPGRVRSDSRGRPCSLIGSDRSHDKKWEAVCIGGRIRPPTASDSLALAPDWITQICLPIRWLETGSESPWEADFQWKWPISLTFDSNSTSDRNQMC